MQTSREQTRNNLKGRVSKRGKGEEEGGG